jgi:alpha-D-ribose 1-methylphosphonate 5-triphosphate synthase subunit PhnG
LYVFPCTSQDVSPDSAAVRTRSTDLCQVRGKKKKSGTDRFTIRLMTVTEFASPQTTDTPITLFPPIGVAVTPDGRQTP